MQKSGLCSRVLCSYVRVRAAARKCIDHVCGLSLCVRSLVNGTDDWPRNEKGFARNRAHKGPPIKCL